MATPPRFDVIRVLTTIGIGLTIAILNAAMIARAQLEEMSEPGRISQTRVNQFRETAVVTLALETSR